MSTGLSADARPEQLLAAAVEHHRAGRLAEAEALYRRLTRLVPGHVGIRANLGAAIRGQGRTPEAIDTYRHALALRPEDAGLFYNLGNALRALARHGDAATSFRRSARLHPESVETLNNLALALRDAGDAGAEAGFRRALALSPDHGEAWSNLGMALRDRGHPAATAALSRAVVLRPSLAEVHHNLGVALKDNGQGTAAIASQRRALALRPAHADDWYSLGNMLREAKDVPDEQAVGAYGRALALRPDHVEARNNLGLALSGLGRHAEASAQLSVALALAPGYAEALNNLGNALKELERLDEAVRSLQRALTVRPRFPEVRINLGVALKALGRVPEAIALYETAISRGEALPMAHYNMGNAFQAQGRLDDAISSFSRAARLEPEYVDAHWNLSLALLSRGDFARGWDLYEWRWRTPNMPPRDFPQPAWRGEDLAGRTILLHAEQGLGDTLHFARYAPLVARRGGRVILEVQPPLVRLFAGMEGVERIVARGDALPDFDVHAPLLSLPLAFGTRLETIPAEVPYLRAKPDEVMAWSRRLPDDGLARVGLVWAGNPRKELPSAAAVDRRRSIKLAQLAPLAGIPGVRFYSLQKGDEAAEQLRAPPPGLVIVDPMDQVTDFADTAALVANLDLVIGVDTSVIHLAGGLGRPVWVLSRFDGCWRWLTDRDDSPWYPTLRLFRQENAGDWTPTIERLAQALRDWARSGGRR